MRSYAPNAVRSRHHHGSGAAEASARLHGTGRCAVGVPRRRPPAPAPPRDAAVVRAALPSSDRPGDSGASTRASVGNGVERGRGLAAVAGAQPPAPLPPGRGGGLRAPPAFLQPLLNAVVAASGGRLASLPPPVVAWLLRALLSVGHCPPPAWLAEAYASLTTRVDELQPNQAAQAYLALASLATTAASHGVNGAAAAPAPAAAAVPVPPPPPPPPAELLTGLYGSLARPPRGGALDPRVALACLEAAAAAGEVPSRSEGSAPRAIRTSDVRLAAAAAADAGSGAGPGASTASSGVGAGQGTAVGAEDGAGAQAASVLGLQPYQQTPYDAAWRLSPPMPQPTVELLLRRAAGLRPLDGAAEAEAAGGMTGLFSLPADPEAEAAVAAARAVVAAARLSNPPRPAAVAELVTLIADNCDGGGPFSGGAGAVGGSRGGGRGSPQLLLRSLSALCTLAAPPLPPSTLEALVGGLEDQLPQLDAVQVSYCVAAVQRLAGEPPDAAAPAAAPAATAAALRFARGPAAAELARQLPDLPAPRLAAALAALPPALRPPPAELAAAAHEALRRCLAAADSDDLAEVLRRLSDADALPLYGWQGALAAAVSQRLQAASAPGGVELLSSQELCNAMFLLAALNYRPGFGWTAAAAAALQPRLLTLSAAQLTNALWALAKFGHRPEGGWSTAAVQALQLQLPSLRPHQLSYGLGSLQRMGCHVSGAVLDEMLGAAAAPDQLQSYPPGDLVLLLMTVARLRHVPSYAFTEAVTERLRPHLTATSAAAEAEAPGLTAAEAAAVSTLDFRGPMAAGAAAAAVAGGAAPLTCQELASVGYALAKLHSRPESEWMSAYMAACHSLMTDFSPDLLASLLWAVGELGQVPGPAWMSSFLSAARPQLGEFAPQDLVSVLSSLAALRTPPPAEWLGEALTVLGARVGGLDGAGVAALLKALVDLDARVSNPKWYEVLCDQVSSFLPLLPPQALVDLVASLGVLGHKPTPDWLLMCSAAAVRAQAQAASAQAAQAQAAQRAAAERADGGAVGVGGAIANMGGGGLGGGGGGGLSVAQLEALVCGLARLGAEPPVPLLQAFFAATATSLTGMAPDRITSLASALAGAGVAPEPAWLDGLATAVRNDVMSYTLVQLDALTRALAVFQGRVPEHGATKDLLAFLREFCLYG